MTDYLRLAQERAPQAVDEQSNPYLSLAREQQDLQQNRARTVIEHALKDDPDLAAERLRLSKTSGVPLNVVERNLEELRLKERARAIDLVTMAQDSPVLYRQLTDPTFATTSVDDLDTLKNLERSVGKGVRYVMGADAKGGLPSDLAGAAKTVGMGATVGVAKMAFDVAGALNDLIGWQSGGQAARGTAQRLQGVMDQYGFQPESSTGQAVRSGLQSAGTNLALLPIGLYRGLYATANQAASTVAGLMATGVGAGAYNKAREQGLNQLQSTIYAIPEGTFEYVFERIPAAKLFGDLAANTGLLRLIGRQTLSEGWTEQVTTLAQDFNEWMNLNPDKTLAQFIQERPEAAYQTFIATLVGVGVQTSTIKGINKIVEAASDKSLQFDQDLLQQQMQLAAASTLRARSPEQFRTHIQRVVEANEGAKSEIYVDGEVLNQQPPEILAQLPESVRQAIPAALETNSTVAIPMADVLTVAPGTELEQILNDNARLRPNAPSRVEAQLTEQFLQQEADRVLQQAADTAVWQQSSETVKQAVLDQLNTAGRFTPDVNEAYATLQANFFSTMAARVGLTPQELYDRYQLRVSARQPGGQVLNAGQSSVNLGGRSIPVTISRADETAGFTLVPVNVAGFDAGFQAADDQFREFYVGPGGTGAAIGDRYQRFAEFAATADSIEAPTVSVDAQGRVSFGNGRHRFAYLRDQEIAQIPVAMDEESLQNAIAAGYVEQGEFNQAAVERLTSAAQRGVRQTGSRSAISAEERAAIQASSESTGVPVAEIEAAVRAHKLAHPVAQGWAPLTYTRTLVEDGKVTHEYQKTPYDFSTGPEGTALEPGTPAYTRRVNAIARSMVQEVRNVFRRAQQGDANARNILAQAGWYKAMRSRLRQEFGGLGDLFADLLGATSPNTPVRENWFNAVDALRRASRGDFDALIPQWEAWADNLEAAETDLRAFFNERLAEGLSKKAIKDLPEFKTKLDAVKAARRLDDALLPTKESGAKYGFNGRNVVRTMVDLWRVVKNADPDIARGGTAPKALNFSGNLIGFRSRATIDVWAARMLQRLAGGRRIPSMAETGVSGDMREDSTTTLQFGFGQDVFGKAAADIRNDVELATDPVLATTNDDDLQAVVWFVEKEIWTLNDWTSAAGEGGSFELEASLTGTNQQAQVKELRRIIDASPKTADVQAAAQDITTAVQAIKNHEAKDEVKAAVEELRKIQSGEIPAYKGMKKRQAELEKIARPPKEATALLDNVDRAKARLEAFFARKTAARAELAALEREVDRFTGGLSIQMSADTQGVDFVPTDAEMAQLAERVRLAAYEADDGNTVLGSKMLSTEGRYGGIERSLDLELVTREGYDANRLWLQMLQEAQTAQQDSTFLSRVLRDSEAYDPLTHRPGVEIYFQSAADAARLEQMLGELAKEGVEFLTVIVDGRRLASTMGGQMPAAVGVRLQYVPEFEQRYGMDNLAGLDDVALAAKIQGKADELADLANRVSQAVPGVSFAGQFWYETQVAFSHQYQEKIDALTAGQPEGAAGATDGQRWTGDTVRAGLESADRQARETAGAQPGGELLGGDALGATDGQPQPGTLNQEPLAQGPRGTFSPEQLLVTLNENADLSTFLHESGHFFLEVLADLASQPNTPQQIKDDMAATLKWFGVPDLATWNGYTLDQKRPYHERWAESFEQYLFEGKAPNPELQPLFRRFRSWLINVYQSLTAFMRGRNLKVSDEIRQVFDRMVATDEQIAQAEEAAGMLPDFEATNEAIEALQARSLRDLKWTIKARGKALKALEKEAKTLRKDVEAEVRAEVEQQPLYKAMNWLKKGETIDPETGDLVKAEKGFRLSTEGLAEMYPETMLGRPDLARLRGMTGKEGLHPDMVADMFGFESGDQLVRAILDAEPIASVIEGITDQRMLERHGDLATPEAREAAANEAVHNEARARALATELKSQAEMINQRQDTGRTDVRGRPITVNAVVEAAKQFALNLAARRRLKDLKSAAWQHRAAEARAGKRWQQLTAEGKSEEAVQAKRDQLLNNYAAKALQDAQVEVRKTLEFFKRVVKGSDEKIVERGRDPDVVNAMRAILAAYDVAPRLEKSALAYMEIVSRNDPAMYSALKPGVDAALLNAKPLTEMTLEELRGLNDELRAMWVLAKRSRQMEVDGNLLDIEEAADELVTRMDDIGIPVEIPGERGAITDKQEAGIKLRFALSILTRVEQWAERLDGRFGGPFLRLVFQPVKDAADRYRTDRVAYRKQFSELLKNVAPFLPQGPIAAPELGYTFGNARDSGAAELLHAILHTGNDSNKRKLLLGRGWATQNADGTLDTSRWDAFIQRLQADGVLRKEHYDFAQGVWDLLEQMKPLAQETHRKVFGRYFAEVTANEVVTPFGTYRGGYVPAQTDSRLVKDAKLRELAEGENESMAYAFPAAPSGFTKSRVEYNQPLLMDLRALAQHMDKVLLFSHMQGAVTDVRRLLTNKRVSYALDRVDPGAYEGMLIPWLNRAAKQVVETPVVGDRKLSRFLSAARSRAGMALMFANLSNTFQQITGFSMAAVKVKPGLMLQSTAAFIADPKGVKTTVAEASPYMKDRMLNEVSAMNDAIEEILVNPTLLQQGQTWTQRHAYFMQAAVDNTMSPIIWTAAYNQAIQQGQDERDAVRFADSVVRQTQGTTLPEDISRFESGPGYARLFTQFVSYFNMMANTNATAVSQIVSEMGLRKGAGRLLYVALAGLLVPIWVAEAIAQAFKGGPEDDEKDGWLDDWLLAVFGLGTIKGLVAQVPIAGQAAQLVVNRFNDNPADDKFSLSPAVSLIESTVSAPASVYNAIVEDGNKQKAVRDVAAAATMITGLPIYGVARPIGYLAGIAGGNIEPTGPVDLARGLVTGTASPESKQR